MSLRPSIALWIAVAAIAGIIIYTLLRGSPSPVSGPQSLVGRSVPLFPLRTTGGRKDSLETYRGRPMVVNLWASWCPPCRAEMPDLQRLAQSEPDITVVGIDEGESSRRAASFAGALGIRYPVLMDGQQQYGRAFQALGLPTTVVVDRKGNVVRAFDGPLSYSQMAAAIAPYVHPQ